MLASISTGASSNELGLHIRLMMRMTPMDNKVVVQIYLRQIQIYTSKQLSLLLLNTHFHQQRLADIMIWITYDV